MQQPYIASRVDADEHPLREGDRVSAPLRPGFPAGTLVKLMTRGFVLVRWDGNVLETLHHRELVKGEWTGAS